MALSKFEKCYLGTAAALYFSGAATYGYAKVEQRTDLAQDYAIAAKCQMKQKRHEICTPTETIALEKKHANENVKMAGAVIVAGGVAMTVGAFL